MKLNLIFIGLVFLSSLVYAGQKITIVDVKGYGLTRSEAIQDGLIEALKQSKGVNIKSKKSFAKNISQHRASVNGVNKSKVEVKSLSQKEIQEATQGLIREYRIINDQRISQNQYEVELSVKMIEYKTPGHSAHKRRKLVVVPSYSSDITFKVMNNHKTAKEVSQRLTQELVSAITQTRKFSVLDRENNSAYENEKNLILSRDAHKDELMKLGNVLGTDYLVVSNLTDFRISNDQEYLSITGQTIDKLKAMATVQYRIIAMATKQIKWSNTTTFEFEPKGNSDEQFFAYSLKKISDDLTNEIIENIYPIKVANISRNGKVILSQGSKLGTIYDVFDLGEKLYDSYTKEFLGYDEVKTGTIKIVRALPKISYGQIIEGNVQKGNICRIQISTNSNDPVTDISEADKPSDVTQSDGGGVILPF